MRKMLAISMDFGAPVAMQSIDEDIRKRLVILNQTVARGPEKAPFEALFVYLPRMDNFSQVMEEAQE